jgi:hypothetical protein
MLLCCSIAFDVGGSSPKKIGRKKTDAEQESQPPARKHASVTWVYVIEIENADYVVPRSYVPAVFMVYGS